MFANSGVASTAASFSSFPTVRKPISERNFKSPAIEKAIATFKQKVKNEELGWLFGYCFPNTLDTTVFYSEKDGRPEVNARYAKEAEQAYKEFTEKQAFVNEYVQKSWHINLKQMQVISVRRINAYIKQH